MTANPTQKTITVYAKTPGCRQCVMTKKVMVTEGLARWDSSNTLTANLVSNIPDVELKTIMIDEPENAGLLEALKAEGLMQAPIVMLNFPVTDEDGVTFDTWSGFLPDHIKATAKALKAGDAQ